MASSVIHVREVSVEEAHKGSDKEVDKVTFLLRLHIANIKSFKKYHGFLNFLVGVSRKQVYSVLIYSTILGISTVIFHEIIIPTLIV